MSYLGNSPPSQNFVAGADQFSGTGSQTAFTLSRNVNTVFDIFVTVSNVPQDPFTAYTVSGNTLTFDGAPPSGTNNIDVVYRATNVQTFVPSPGVSQQFATGTAASPAITFIGNTNTGIYSPAANTLAFSTNGTEDARFDSVGNFGLGVTPAAWSNGAKPIQAVNASFWGLSGFPTFTSIGSNYYYDGNYKYIGTGEATDYYQYLGTHAWRTAVSGTAGNTISFTEVMATNTNGGVKVLNTIGVGNTTPSTSGAGITFPATQSASSNANTLDDYEEGTWTPTITAASGTYTTVTASGSYIKVGNAVTVRIRVDIGNNGTAATRMNIANFPFAAVNTSAMSGATREDQTVGTCFIASSIGTNSITVNRYDGAYGFITGSGFTLCITYVTS